MFHQIKMNKNPLFFPLRNEQEYFFIFVILISFQAKLIQYQDHKYKCLCLPLLNIKGITSNYIIT